MENRRYYPGVDGFRIAAALLVAAIHTSPLAGWSAEADFFLTRVLARTAVPFFFMVTGRFVLADYLEVASYSPKSVHFGKTGRSGGSGSAGRFGRLGRYLRKILLLYAVSILLYLPVGIYAGHYVHLTVEDVCRMLVFDGTFYHLWYFPACVLGTGLVCLFVRFWKVPGAFAAAGALYLFGLFGDSYYGLAAQCPPIALIYEKGFSIWSYTRNGLFMAPIFLLLGVAMASGEQRQRRMRRGQLALGLFCSFALMTVEAFILRYFGLPRHDSMYFFLVPTVFFLYGLLEAWQPASDKGQPGKTRGQERLPVIRTISTGIYMLHPGMIVAVRGIAKFSGIRALVDNGIVHYVCVVFLTVAVVWPAAVFLAFWRKRRAAFIALYAAMRYLGRRDLQRFGNIAFSTFLSSLAYCAIQAGKWETACNLYRSLTAIHPEKFNFKMNYLNCCIQTGRYKDGLEIAQKLVKLNPKSIDIQKKLAYLYRLTKKPQSAVEILEKLLKRGKIDFEICYNLAIAYVNMDELEQGRENLKKCISLEPDNPVARKDLGIVYLKMNYADWALDEFQTAINLEPGNPEHYFNYAVALYQTQEYIQADEYFKKALELDTDNPAYLAYYGENLLALNKADEAKEILLKTLKSGKASYKAKFTLAKIYFEDKNYKTSRDLLLDIKDAPNNPEILNLLAQSYLKLKEYKTAAGIFNKLAENYPDNHIILCDLAKCEIKMGEYKNAKKHVEQALVLFPDFEYGLKILKEVQQNEPEQ